MTDTAPMMRWLCILLLVAGASGVQGAPASTPAHAEDELQQFIADRGLAGRLEEVRGRISDAASELVVNAMGFLGVPYRRGGNSADCLI